MTRERQKIADVPEGERMYAITESELKKYEGLFFLDDGATSDFKKIRSRPHSGMCMERNGAQGQQPSREEANRIILALFRRIGEQPDLAAEWSKMPNAERNYMAGDFFNIIWPDAFKQTRPQDASGKAELLNDMKTKILERIKDQTANAKKGNVGSHETDLINATYREIIGDIDHELRIDPASPGKASGDVLAELERDLKATISCNMRWGTSLEPYYVGVNTHATLMLQKIAALRQVQQQ